jgi:hypothetical protein
LGAFLLHHPTIGERRINMDEFLNNDTNHSVEQLEETTADNEVIENGENQTDSTDTTGTAEQSDDFIEVKYNKELMKIRRDEAPTYIQKGLNYDKVKQKAEELEKQVSYLDRLARLSGYQTTEEFLQAVEQAEQQRRIQEEAQRLGIDEEVYRQHFQPVNDELNQLRQELQSLKQQEMIRQIETEVNQLKQKYDDFDKYSDQIFNLAAERGYSLEDAYKIVTYEDRIQSITKQKEQEVLAKVTGRDEKQVLASSDKPAITKLNPAEMSFEQIEELSRRARMGERITF